MRPSERATVGLCHNCAIRPNHLHKGGVVVVDKILSPPMEAQINGIATNQYLAREGLLLPVGIHHCRAGQLHHLAQHHRRLHLNLCGRGPIADDQIIQHIGVFEQLATIHLHRGQVVKGRRVIETDFDPVQP